MIKHYIRFRNYLEEDVRFYFIPTIAFGNFMWDEKEDFVGFKVTAFFWTLYMGAFTEAENPLMQFKSC